MSARRLIPPTACLLLVALAALSHSAAPPATPLPSEIARLIEQLGDDSFAVREAATKKLRAAGEAAEEALDKAAASTDAEVVKRAKTLLSDMKWGIFPETPKAVADLVGEYRTADKAKKREVIGKLLAAGPYGLKVVVRVSRYETDPLVRKEVFGDISATLAKAGPPLVEDNRPQLEALLELALAADPKGAVGNYAAYHLLNGSLKEKIASWEARAKAAKGAAKEEREILAMLYRAAGDAPKALQSAEAAEREDVVEGILYEKADWKALDAKPGLTDPADPVRALGYRAAYARLAGNTKVLDACITDLLKLGRDAADQKGYTLPHAKALFLNGRPAEAVDLLSKGDSPRVQVHELLTTRMEFKAAADMVEEAKKQGSREAQALELRHARALHLLGEKEKAFAILDGYAKGVKARRGEPWVKELVEAEAKVGRVDNALRVIANTLVPGVPVDSTLLPAIYDRKGDEAKRLFTLIAESKTGDSAENRLFLMRDMLAGKAKANDVKAFLANVDDFMAKDTNAKKSRYRVAGEVAVTAKLPDLAEKAFRAAGTARALMRVGDLKSDKKDYAGAAAVYRAAYRLARVADLAREDDDEGEGDGLPSMTLTLEAQALRKLGREDEAKASERLAHLLPLGDLEMRLELARGYMKRKLTAAARREFDVMRKVGDAALYEHGSYYTGEGLRGKAIEAADRKDFGAAADGFEQAFLRCMHPAMNFQRTTAYVSVPAFIRTYRARAYLAAGDAARADAEAASALASVPGGVETGTRLVGEFDRAGEKKRGDALHAAILKPNEELAKAHPKSAWLANQCGWLCATSRRDLEKGLAFARKAVELSPEASAYRDTLGEVLFQLGKKDEALASAKKALELSPGREYFKRQIRRIEKGDPKAPLPTDEDEDD